MRPTPRILALLAACTLLAVPVSSAWAGSDGQEIAISLSPSYCTGGPLTGAATIEGYNQAGHLATWHGMTHTTDTILGPGPIVIANGWWWVGNVVVEYHQKTASGVQAVIIHTYVPKKRQAKSWWPEFPNYVHVDCHGTEQWYGTATSQSAVKSGAVQCVDDDNPYGQYVVDTTDKGWYGTALGDVKVGNDAEWDGGSAFLPVDVTSTFNSIVCGTGSGSS